MSGFSSLFSGLNFRNTIQKYASHHSWRVAEVDNDHALLRFSMQSGRTQILYIMRYDATLEFSVPSLVNFDSENEIPHYLSTLLLRRNTEKKYGFWCIEKVGGKFVYSYMHNAEIQLIDVEYFGKVVRALLNECDDFEGSILKMLS